MGWLLSHIDLAMLPLAGIIDAYERPRMSITDLFFYQILPLPTSHVDDLDLLKSRTISRKGHDVHNASCMHVKYAKLELKIPNPGENATSELLFTDVARYDFRRTWSHDFSCQKDARGRKLPSRFARNQPAPCPSPPQTKPIPIPISNLLNSQHQPPANISAAISRSRKSGKN